MQLSAKGRFRLDIVVLYFSVLALTSIALYYNWFKSLDTFIYDSLLPYSAPSLDSRILIVGIDEQSLAHFGAWPWPRDLQARIVRTVAQGQPLGLLADIIYADTSNEMADAELARAASEIPVFAAPVVLDAIAQNQQLIEVMPYPELLQQVDLLGHVHVDLDVDAIGRGTYLYQGVGEPYWPHLALALAAVLEPDSAASLERNAMRCGSTQEFSLANHRCGYVRIPFSGPPGTVPTLSARELMKGTFNPTLLSGKILLLGLTAAGVDDAITVPVSKGTRPMSGVELNANLLNGILKNRMIFPVNSVWIWTLSFLCVSLPALLLPRMAPKPMLSLALCSTMLPITLSAMALVGFQYYLPLGAATAFSLICYPLWSWRRLEVAFGFIDAEMQRLENEQRLWGSVAGEDSNTPDAARLARLLNAESSNHISGPAIEMTSSKKMIFRNGPETSVVLERKKDFSPEERKLVDRLNASVESSQVPPLPGENLAARIRLLQDQAETVRLGRDLGLRSLERTPSGVCILSPVGKILFENTAFSSFVPIPPGGLLRDEGLERISVIPTPLGQNWIDITREVVFKQQITSFETRLQDERMIYVNATLLDEFGTWLVTLVDMTQVREAERHREEALAFLSHDLRSPMLSILALVRQTASSERLKQIESYASRGLAASEQFLQLSRVQSSEIFETLELDILSVVDNAVDQVYVLAQEKQIRVDVDALMAYESGIWVVGNGELLERAFENLLNNAVKYSDVGSTVTLNVGQSDAENVIVEILDQGVGIAVADLERIFDPYFRASDGGKASRGAGLGLRFVKTVVERHGGKVEVTSQRGHGSKFSVHLPRLASIDEPSAPLDSIGPTERAN